MIENTSKRDPELMFLEAMVAPDGFVERMESAGQAQLVNSTMLPTKGSDELEALGFTLGDVDRADPLFRAVTLPEGWRKEATDHSMWTRILDPQGRERVAVFYKAAFYDRDAFCRAATPEGYVWALSHSAGQPVIDNWCTPEHTAEAARKIIEDAKSTIELYQRPNVREGEPGYADERVAESQARIAWAERLIAQVS